jgi:SAM-dependent methyltransferase
VSDHMGSVTDGYMIRGGEAGMARLDVLDLAFRESTEELLRRCGVASGARCLEVGSGGGHATRQLARAVEPGGHVTGLDIDPDIIELARRDARAQGLDNVEFRVADAGDLPVEDGLHDVVFARLLLTHLRDPLGAVLQMVRAVRPGGVVIVEDLDWDGVFCYPPAPAFQRYSQIHAEVHRRRGGDPRIGPKLPAMLREAGLTGVDLRLAHPAHLTGRAKSLHALTWENIADSILDEGILERAEIEAVQQGLLRLTDDADTILGQPRIYQVWGRRPAE